MAHGAPTIPPMINSSVTVLQYTDYDQNREPYMELYIPDYNICFNGKTAYYATEVFLKSIEDGFLFKHGMQITFRTLELDRNVIDKFIQWAKEKSPQENLLLNLKNDIEFRDLFDGDQLKKTPSPSRQG